LSLSPDAVRRGLVSLSLAHALTPLPPVLVVPPTLGKISFENAPLATTIRLANMTDLTPLDNAAWHALNTAHRSMARANGLARRYPADVSPLTGLREPSRAALADLRILLAPGEPAALATLDPFDVPTDFDVVMSRPLDQMYCPELTQSPPTIAPLELGPADVPDMLALTAATEPGPFLKNTIRMGRYFGVRSPIDGRLIAMAGQRLALDNFREISAVCTDPAHRGQGHARALVAHLAAQILRENKTPFLHVVPENTPAKSAYENVGFRLRRTLQLMVVTPRTK
jgi:GNAT superfamily N-acetyltransferase